MKLVHAVEPTSHEICRTVTYYCRSETNLTDSMRRLFMIACIHLI